MILEVKVKTKIQNEIYDDRLEGKKYIHRMIRFKLDSILLKFY